MKNIVKSICLVLLIVVAGNFSAIAQDSPLLKKETKEKVGTNATDAKKAAGDLKSEKGALGQDKKQQTGSVVNSTTSEKQDDAKAVLGQSKKTVTDAAGKNADEMEGYKEKMKKAKTAEERMALDKEMKKAQAKSNLKGDSPSEVIKDKVGEEIKGGVTKGKPIETSNEDKDKNYTDLKGRALGKAKATDAKMMLEKKEVSMVRRDANIERSRGRIETARKRLQDQVETGQISTEEATAKQARIDNAEQRLKEYETRVEAGKQKLIDHKTTVNELYIKD